ncbi:hypothetical protein TH63_03800 [Rufibacter radiotolerans]|uniref:Outer membrane protein beta-barrel domain-containing protein n=1 Tax=Rufibacter radiotolerans TaxID=1379910 RepID=A0A0H4VH23_9BACT|nr:hypothetical protein TH63_03800 [Rufibacter radiotolerans]
MVSLAAPLSSMGQRTRQTTSNSVLRLFKVSNKLTLTAGGGVSVMNSDYAADNRSTKNLLKSNGFGVTAGLGAIRQVTPYLAAFVNVDFYQIKGEQTFTLEQKDLSFKSSVVSGTGALAMHLASRNTLNNFYNRSFQGAVVIVPYVKLGVGLLGYDVDSNETAPEGTEGKSYPAMALVIPIGGGVRFRLSDQISIATDLTLSMPSTDFLDNREGTNSYLGSNDKFASFTIKALYTLPKKSVR